MKFNRAKLWNILKPWIDFDEGEIGDCPELGELLGKVVEHEKGFEKQLREMEMPEKYVELKGIYVFEWLMQEILGDKTKENTEK